MLYSHNKNISLSCALASWWAQVLIWVPVCIWFSSRWDKSLTAESPTITLQLKMTKCGTSDVTVCLWCHRKAPFGSSTVESTDVWCRRWHEEECQSWTWCIVLTTTTLFFFFFLKKHPCKYFSVLQKKEEKKKKKVCTVLLGGQVLLHFLKKESDWCPETWNVFVVVLRSKCIIVCYLLKISPIFLKIIICHYSLWVVFDGTCIYPRCSNRYSHARPLDLQLSCSNW